MEREIMEYDVIIVGGGPAGLSAAIRLKQLAGDALRDVSVCVLEKGAEIGAHILSGAIIEPRAMTELFPDWQARGAPLKVAVKDESFTWLTRKSGFNIPSCLLPPQMHNKGNYIISLGNLCRWLATQAEELGVDIYPGFAATRIVYDEAGTVVGVATGDMGVDKAGRPKSTYEPGVELRGGHTLFADGARGSLSKQVIARYDLSRAKCPQTYGLGMKELWRLSAEKHNEGKVMHTAGWPMDHKTWGGSFIYHLDNSQAVVGYVVALDYKNPHLSPFDEFQRFKMHRLIRPLLEGGKRVSYGARVINEGGLQSLPKLTFPGGALIGCAAGFLNVPKIKGSHTAMKSGMLAAEALFKALSTEYTSTGFTSTDFTSTGVLPAGEEGGNHREIGTDVVTESSAPDLSDYEKAFEKSWLFDELYRARNFRACFMKLGAAGFLFGGFELKFLKKSIPWTLRWKHQDHEVLKPADQMPKIEYPKPDDVVSFDRNSSVYLSAISHDEDQPVHLNFGDETRSVKHNLTIYNAPEQLYCPAGVYEIVYDQPDRQPRLQINAQNCVHCKTCDIKDPTGNISWAVPEGGAGPNYGNM